MAITNHERVGKALDLLKEGLRPFVEREMKAQHAQLWFEQVKASVRETQSNLFGTEDRAALGCGRPLGRNVESMADRLPQDTWPG